MSDAPIEMDLKQAAMKVVDAESEWEVHEAIDDLREALGRRRLDNPRPDYMGDTLAALMRVH